MPGLSVREAAQRAHTTDRTVRRWIAEGKLPATRHADGWTVDESDLAAMLDARMDARPSTTDRVRPHDQADDWRQYVADLRSQLETKDRQIAELHTLLAQAQRALPIPSETAPGSPPANRTVDPTGKPAQSAQRAPWWAPWRR